jgi:hypothetical protein
MPMLKSLSPESLAITKECLRAAVEGPFFPDWEFDTLFGVERDVVKAVYESWPDQTVDDDDFGCAVVGSLGHLLGYPHRQEEVWSNYISVTPERVREVQDEIIALGL